MGGCIKFFFYSFEIYCSTLIFCMSRISWLCGFAILFILFLHSGISAEYNTPDQILHPARMWKWSWFKIVFPFSFKSLHSWEFFHCEIVTCLSASQWTWFLLHDQHYTNMFIYKYTYRNRPIQCEWTWFLLQRGEVFVPATTSFWGTICFDFQGKKNFLKMRPRGPVRWSSFLWGGFWPAECTAAC